MKTYSNNEPLDRVLRPREVSEYVGLSVTTLWRLRREGSMPQPIKLGALAVGWRKSAIDAWLATRS